MSFAALAAVDHVEPPSAHVLLILFVLASYAGPDGSCFVSQETLSARTKLSVRCVRDNLKLAESAGLITMVERRRRDGSRSSNGIQLTFYTPEVAPEKACRARPVKGARRADRVEADLGEAPLDVVGQPATVAGCELRRSAGPNRQMATSQPAPGAGPTTFEPVPNLLERSDDLSQQACADERRSHGAPSLEVVGRGYDALFAAYPASGLKRTNDAEARAAYLDARADVGEAALLAAVQAFAVDPQLRRGDHGAPGLQRWLEARRYLAYADRPQPASNELRAPPVVAAVPCPPAELREAFVAAFGEAFAGSYWPAGWLAERGVLVTRTGFARDRLRRDTRAWLADRDLTVIAAADLAAPEQDAA